MTIERFRREFPDLVQFPIKSAILPLEPVVFPCDLLTRIDIDDSRVPIDNEGISLPNCLKQSLDGHDARDFKRLG